MFELIDDSESAKKQPADETAGSDEDKGAANTAAATGSFSLASYERLLNAPGEEVAEETLPAKTATGGASANK